ncbi:MAG: LamG domain-containing protein [Bacteroidota bacterium]
MHIRIIKILIAVPCLFNIQIVSSQEVLSTDGLLAYYPFDGNTMDYSGKNNHAYPVGEAIFKDDRLGNEKKSLDFSNENFHLNVPNSHILSSIRNEFTLAFWIYMHDSNKELHPVLSKSSALNNSPLYALHISTRKKGEIEFIIYGKRHRIKDVSIQKEQWFHIAVVVNDKFVQFFMDGSLIGKTKVRTSKFDKNDPLEIGKGRKGTLNYLEGRLDELYLFSRSLEKNEVNVLMNKSAADFKKVTESFMPMDENFTLLNAKRKNIPATVISGKMSYADKVANGNAKSALGPPDDNDKQGAATRSYSLGCMGEVVLEFTDYPLIDVPGPDLFVFEAGPVAEPTKLSISKDGINWITYGEIKGGIAMVDLVDLIQEDEEFYFVKLKDLVTQCSGPRAGADIDAVGVIVPRKLENNDVMNISGNSNKSSIVTNQTPKEKKSGSNSNKDEIIIVDKKEIKIFTKKVSIKVWDHLEEDGDLINLYLNDELLFSNLKVSKKGEVFDIELKSGENSIQVEALNEGSTPPNTSAIKVFVNDKAHEIILSAKKGARDSLKIILN